VVLDVRRLLELVVDGTGTGLIVATPDRAVLWANRALAELVGMEGDPTTSVAPAVLPRLAAALDREGAALEWQRGADRRWVDVRCQPLAADADGVPLLLYEVIDATDLHLREEAARRRELRANRLEALARVGMWEWELATDTVTWSDELLAMFGLPAGMALDYLEYRSLLHPDDVPLIEGTLQRAVEAVEPFSYTHRMYLADRMTMRVFECFGEVVADAEGKATRVLGTAHDITEQRRIQAELAYQAERDPLTSLPNQRGITAHLRDCLARGARTGALLLVGIDDFKCLNERQGAEVADDVLRWLPAQLVQHGHHAALVGRLGGDEFALHLPDTTPAEALAAAEAIVAGVAGTPFAVRGGPLTIGVSVGVAPLQTTPDTDSLLAEADHALRRAKAAGKGRAELFDAAQRGRLPARPSIVRRLSDAMEQGGLQLHVQPVLDLRSRSVASYEVLLRLHDGIDPPLAPETFLRQVERDDLIVRLDRWVLEQAVAAMSSRAGRGRGLRLEVNVSVRSLADPTFADDVIAMLKAGDVDPGRLGLEIPEPASIASPEVARHLADRLARAGCRFVLDDFSAGLGSFVHLQHLPFTAVKVSGAFLRQSQWTLGDTVLIESVVAAARGLGMRTVAKGVERESQVGHLTRLGVHRGQGFHLGSPQPLRRLLGPRG